MSQGTGWREFFVYCVSGEGSAELFETGELLQTLFYIFIFGSLKKSLHGRNIFSIRHRIFQELDE